jgi:hypothetical protein
MAITTIKLEKSTKERLNKLKIHNKESYDNVLQKILGILSLCKVDPIKARHKLSQIDQARRYTKETNKVS